MKKITVKLAVFFILLLSISSLLSFCLSIFFSGSTISEMKQNQAAIADILLELSENTNLTSSQIVKMVQSSMYDITLLDNIEELNLASDEFNKLNNKQMVFLYRNRLKNVFTILKLGDSYVKISQPTNNTILAVTASRLWLAGLFYVVIGTLLVSLLAKSVVNPVLQLNKAVQEVAKGNFDIEVTNQREDEIGQLTKNFNKMTRELKNFEYLRKDFATNVSHEFKTPLASIYGYAKLLQNPKLTAEESTEYTTIIMEEAKRLANLSSNMLKISNLESQEIVDKRSLFSLDEQIRKSILILEPAWSKKNIEFEIELEKVMYLGDEEMLQQVWLNLLDNAIKFTDRAGVITVTLQQKDKAIEVKVSDNGIGMSADTMKHIFEKFYQGDSNRATEGRGLGLSLVRRILDLYNADIRVESKLHEGSTFTITLPVAAEIE
ncbi:MAG: HAMP domain-containing histidine kinase [Firmicutes bacterium]|nr:HAMP domain-containing histidine kinase [Bacillota bacterium]